MENKKLEPIPEGVNLESLSKPSQNLKKLQKGLKLTKTPLMLKKLPKMNPSDSLVPSLSN